MRLTNGILPASANYLHKDELGSVRAVTNAAGVVIARAVYKPFGEQTEWQSAGLVVQETKGFIGERFDADAGLQYLNARYCDPQLGMFIQPDWWEVTQHGVGTNRFAYVGGDSVNGKDPTGLIVETIWDVASILYDGGKIGVGWWTDDVELMHEGMIDIAVDGASTLIPGVPAGSSKAARAARTVANGGKFASETQMALRGAGRLQDGQQLHHVAFFSGGGQFGAQVRDKLAAAGIKLNDIENGIGLTYHAGSHVADYSKVVWERIGKLDGEAAIRAELKNVGDELIKVDRMITGGQIRPATQGSSRSGGTGQASTINEWLRLIFSGGSAK